MMIMLIEGDMIDMKDYSKESLERSRPSHSALECVNFCLNCLYEDKNLTISDTVGDMMTLEELIGALLQARDVLEEVENNDNGKY